MLAAALLPAAAVAQYQTIMFDGAKRLCDAGSTLYKNSGSSTYTAATIQTDSTGACGVPFTSNMYWYDYSASTAIGDSILFFGGIGGYCGGYAGDNRNGAVIGSAVAKASACECAQHCGVTANCVAWTFDSLGQFTPGTPSCYLRTALGGYVGNCPGCISASMDWYGTTLRTVTVEHDLNQWKFNMHFPANGVPAASGCRRCCCRRTKTKTGTILSAGTRLRAPRTPPRRAFPAAWRRSSRRLSPAAARSDTKISKEVWACSVDYGTAVTPTHTPTCVQQPDMTHVRVGHSLVVFDGDLYAIGGETNTTSTFLETFDGTSWTAPSSVSLPVQSGYTALGDTAAVVLAGTILALRLERATRAGRSGRPRRGTSTRTGAPTARRGT